MQEFYKKKYKYWSNLEKKTQKYRGHLLIENAFKTTNNNIEKIFNTSRFLEILDIKTPDELIIKRITDRYMCKECGATYNKTGILYFIANLAIFKLNST